MKDVNKLPYSPKLIHCIVIEYRLRYCCVHSKFIGQVHSWNDLYNETDGVRKCRRWLH